MNYNDLDLKKSSQSIPIENFTDKILEYAANTFSVMHVHFLKKIWGDNNVTHKLHGNQITFDPASGRYEVYIPTRDSVDFNLEYSRIAIQILPMVSNEEKHNEAYKLSVPIKEPLGKIESELLILIAPRQHHWGLVKGFKHRNLPGYFTAIFVNKSPEIIWKRVLDQVCNFFKKRLNGLMNSLGFEKASWEWTIGKRNDFISNIVVEKFSYVLRQTFLTLKSLLEHFYDVMRKILCEIGVQNMAKQAIKPLIGLKPDILSRVFTIIREDLKNNLKFDLTSYEIRVLRGG